MMINFTALSASALLYGAAASALFFLVKIVYRLTLHPLASFPGPKLGAITNMYGGYFDLSPSSHSYVHVLPALHAKYGPIIRAWPNELHIHDMDAYNQMFKAGTKFSKEPIFYTGFTYVNGALNTELETKDALAHKKFFSSYLSRESTRRAEPLIHTFVSKFLGQLQEKVSEGEEGIVNLSKGFRCLTLDVILNFTFNEPLGALESPDFEFPMTRALYGALTYGQWIAYFPGTFQVLFRWIDKLPSWFLEKHMEPLALTKWCMSMARRRILELKARSTNSSDNIPTMFDIALNPDARKGLPTLTVDQLSADTLLLLLAGTDTTSLTLTMATYRVLRDPSILRKLQAELGEAMPRKDSQLEYAELERLPYLRAVVRETLRTSTVVPGHLPRVVPVEGVLFCGQRISPGTIVSSSAHLYHLDANIFPEPETFRPERWLVSEEVSKELEKNMMPFSRGSRMCTGINLAYTELYLTLGHLFRRFDMTLHGTSDADMELKDCITVKTMGELKVKLRDREE